MLLGLVISHVNYKEYGKKLVDDFRCEVFFGPNDWLRDQIVPIRFSRLKPVSRTYSKEVE